MGYTSPLHYYSIRRQMSYDVSTFQGLIFAVQDYWQKQGFAILQPLDMEVGAGTFHPATFLRSIGAEPWRAAYVQPFRLPTAISYEHQS